MGLEPNMYGESPLTQSRHSHMESQMGQIWVNLGVQILEFEPFCNGMLAIWTEFGPQFDQIWSIFDHF